MEARMSDRTKAILTVLSRGKEDKVAREVMKVFGVSTMAECHELYEMVGKAERASLDAMVERVAKDASAAFWLGVDNELA